MIRCVYKKTCNNNEKGNSKAPDSYKIIHQTIKPAEMYGNNHKRRK
jgi:hypothetical protein